MTTVAFELDGQPFVALNGGPIFTFSPAMSLVVNCETQREMDDLWERLPADGEKEECGWLKDRHGVCGQIVPSVIGEMMSDPAKSERVAPALLQMKTLDMAGLKNGKDMTKGRPTREPVEKSRPDGGDSRCVPPDR